MSTPSPTRESPYQKKRNDSVSSVSKRSPSPKRKNNGSPSRSQSGRSSSSSRVTSAKQRRGSAKQGSSMKQPASATSSKNEKSSVRSTKIAGVDLKGSKVLDMSGMGMTSVPLSITSTIDIVELDLSSNNLRILPAEMQRLVNLEKLDISKNGLRCVSPEDYSGIPLEFANLKQLKYLKISECNLPFIPPVIWRLPNIQHLDVSRNKINLLVPEVGNLVTLEKINLQQTSINTLPPEIACCQELEEILLWGNAMESLPETLPEMPKLKKLVINYRSFSSVVDLYMENLLRKGQIRSEHIPNVIFELPSLECLDFESCKINFLPHIYNKNILELYLCKNFLQQVPESLYNLIHLQILDLSHNFLQQLPEEIGNLKSLKLFKVNNNNFEKVPSTIGHLTELEELNMSNNRIRRLPSEISNLKNLRKLLLENNSLQSLPDSICELYNLSTLDLTNNSLKNLPLKLYDLKQLTEAHTYKKLHKNGLWLYQNPLETPPPEIWKSDKPDKIFEYLKTQHIVRTENLQRQKILIFGEPQCGKTSLMYSLLYNKSYLSQGVEEITRVLTQIKWKTDNNVEFLLNDFGGDRNYYINYPLFIDLKALVLLVYDSSSFTEEKYEKMIGKWIDLLVANAPGTVLRLVGTKTDLHDNQQELETQKETILRMVQQQLKSYNKSLTEELSIIDREVEIIQASQSSVDNLRTEAEDAVLKLLQVRQRKLVELKSCPIRLLPQINFVSSSDGINGIPELILDLELLAIDRQLFPFAQRFVPENWKRFCAKLKRHKGIYLLWDQVEEIASKLGIKENEIENCIQNYHDTGELIWFSDVSGLSEILFHRPRELIKLLASLFRHDINDFMCYEKQRMFRNKGKLTGDEFKEVKEQFKLCGQVSRPLLNCLLFYHHLSEDELTDILELLPLLDLCYTIPEPEIPTGQLYKLPLLVIPSYNSDANVSEVSEYWAEKPLDNEKEASVVYTFPFHNTFGIFSKCAAAIQDLVLSRMDWKTAVYATTENESLLMREGLDSQSGIVIKITVRGTNFGSILELMADLVQSINGLLIRHPGIYWKLDFPMKNNEFLSKLTTTPDIKFENPDIVLMNFSS